jgi:hypothetical protein
MSLLTRSLLASLTSVALLTGCSSGRHASVYVPNTKPMAGAAVVAPVVAPTPAPAPAPVVAGASAEQPAAAPAKDAKRTKAQRAHDRKVLRKERASAARARKRAAARQAYLRQKLNEARSEEAKAKAGQQEALDLAADAKPAKGDKAPISASDVSDISQTERDKRSDAEARASVVRFHELLDKHDKRACDLLTPKLLHSIYGDDDPGAGQRCAAGAEGITDRVSVQILRSAASGRHALLDTVTYIGDSSIHQGLALVLVDGTWLIDVVQRQEDPQP